MRKAFTLIELLVSITILSMIMIFLYKSYAMLNQSNSIFKEESKKIIDVQKIKKVIYYDFLLAQKDSIHIKNIQKGEDFVYLQSSNSIHQRFNPYITYIVKDKKLYRLESLKMLNSYDIEPNSEFDVDFLGEIEVFKVYKTTLKNKDRYLINIDFIKNIHILLKVKNLEDK